MDRDLLRQSLGCHGPSLLSLLRSEQQDNPHFRGLLGPAADTARGAPPLQARKERRGDNIEIQKFISRKADLLFALSWKQNVPTVSETNEENEDYYAVMPPLEQFMDVPSVDRRELFFRDVERGDVVIGRISSIREFGFFMVLICLGSGIIRDISHLEITALCPLRDVPSHSNHGDPLSYYQTGDLIRAGIKDIDRYHEKLVVSLYSSSLPSHLSDMKLGVISSEDLPLHYRRSVELNSNSLESYENVMQHSMGFMNPGVVEFLLGKLGISESNPPSLMRGLQRTNFSEEDFAFTLRKKQSASWALKWLEEEEKLLNAESYYKKALTLDETFKEAEDALSKLHRHMQKSLELREKQAEKEEKQKSKKIETSAEKLRKLLKEEKRLKKKRKRSTSSSSSVSSTDQVVSSSSSSSSSGHKKHKKRKRNRSESSRNSKRHSSKASSHPPDQNRKEESYLLPANTSASFLNQKQEMEKLLENQGRIKERERGNTQSSSSTEIPDNFGGRSEDSRDFYNSSRTQASSSKTEKPCKPDRYYSSRRDFSSSFGRNSEEKTKNLNRKFEKGAEGRKEHYRKRESGSMRYSTSPAGLDCSWKSVEKSKKYANTGLHDFSRNDEEQRVQLNTNQKKESENREENYGDKIAEDLGDDTLNGKERSESNVKKNLPQNLLTIFNQIAEFEKEKGNKQKN
ncbi:tetratricopeptide repeat protein 14 isoform X2 [Petaurus breviceps papuanus]|uniref:tetratricopeptide repeat protein 14 isoform X2 n=1 Tax=Petaurus breviceps papuanus TaxID=3040969 RepID=UPI0036DE243B